MDDMAKLFEMKTTEELRQELYEKLAAKGSQYLQEIATPGVVQPVKKKDIH